MPQKSRVTLQSINELVVEVLRRMDTFQTDITGMRGGIASLDGRVAGLEGKVAALDERVASLEGKVVELDGRVVGLDRRVGGLETVVGGLQGSVVTLQGTVDRMLPLVARIPVIETRLTNVEREIQAIRLRLDNLASLYEHHDKTLEILDHEYVSITAALKRLEDRFDKLEVDQLHNRVRALEDKVAALEKRTLN